MNLLHYIIIIVFLLLIIIIYYNINYNLFILDIRKKSNNIILSNQSLGLVNDCKILQYYINLQCNIKYHIINIFTLSAYFSQYVQYIFVKINKFNSIIVVESPPIYLNKDMCDNIILVPNSDFLDINKISIYSTILTKNYYTYNLLIPYHMNVKYIGFTSMIQKHNNSLQIKNKKYFIHMAGKSPYKGTIRLIQFWRDNIKYMKKHDYYLIIILRHILILNTTELIHSKYMVSIEKDNIYYYKTREECHINIFDCMFHICTSENEGFGHYINEAKSAGCIVITLDNPPMNEIITNDFGFLIKNNMIKRYNKLVDRYIFNKDELFGIFKKIESIDDNMLNNMSIKALESFYLNHNIFLDKINALF